MGKKSSTIIKCPKCGTKIKLNIANAIDEEAEVWECPNCQFIFRYVES